jgi:hypothetical protein
LQGCFGAKETTFGTQLSSRENPENPTVIAELVRLFGYKHVQFWAESQRSPPPRATPLFLRTGLW